ncbi:MAG: hypothetical protein H6Q72_911 [Firmicutes bacterium]|nr:hypothetical protein [Bacillota bacterium]
MQIILKDPEKLKVIMLKKGFTQRSLAKKSIVSDTTINHLINGKRNVSAPIAQKIISSLECEFDDIFFVELDYKSNQKGGAA